mgnify:CR=1 FL=1
MLYRIEVYLTKRNPSGYKTLTSIPTFFLDSHVQGIISTAHAEKIATEMILCMAPVGSTVSVVVSNHNPAVACDVVKGEVRV